MNLVFIEPVRNYDSLCSNSLYSCCSFVSTFDYLSYLGIIAKGLYENEKKLIKIALFLGFLFFILGVLFAYFMVIPMSLRFFTKIAIEQVRPYD